MVKDILGNEITRDIYGNPLAKKNRRDKQPPHLKSATRQRWWGNKLLGECFCCGRKLHYDDAEVGHIQAASKNGKWAPENCRLICKKPCNSGMGNTNMKVYMRRYYPERYAKLFPKEEKETIKKPRTKLKPSNRKDTWIYPLTGKKEKFNPLRF